jgi:hypothetical protein
MTWVVSFHHCFTHSSFVVFNVKSVDCHGYPRQTSTVVTTVYGEIRRFTCDRITIVYLRVVYGDIQRYTELVTVDLGRDGRNCVKFVDCNPSEPKCFSINNFNVHIDNRNTSLSVIDQIAILLESDEELVALLLLKKKTS